MSFTGIRRVLSLRQSIQDLDRAEARFQAAAEAFARAVEASAEHVVEVSTRDAASFREDVRTLATRLAAAQKAGPAKQDELDRVRETYRERLRAYADKATHDVRSMREDLNAAAVAMQSFAASITESTAGHETILKRDLSAFRQVLDAEDSSLEPVRRLRLRAYETLDSIDSNFEDFKRAHAMVVAQLRDEIRVLQTELARDRATPAPQAHSSEPHNSSTPASHPVGDATTDQFFGAYLLHVPEFAALEVKYPVAVFQRATDELREAFGRLTGTVPTECCPGTYATIASAPPPEDLDTLRQQLTSCHVFQQDGLPRTLRLEPRLTWVARGKGEPPAAFVQRVTHQAATLSNQA